MGHLRLLLILLWVGVTVSTLVDLQKRIIGGKICDREERQYHVKLTADDKFKCGGSLIDKMWILTAAHCWKDKSTMKAVLGLHPDKNQEIVEIEGEPVVYSDHDIMLLKLKKAITTIEPVKLPDDCENHLQLNDIVQVAGFGATTAGPNNKKQSQESEELNCVDIQLVACHAPSKGPLQHCLLYKSPLKDTCPGDSGGGVVYNKHIYGVHKGGGKMVCKTAGIFLHVCKYIDWIKDVIKK